MPKAIINGMHKAVPQAHAKSMPICGNCGYHFWETSPAQQAIAQIVSGKHGYTGICRVCTQSLSKGDNYGGTLKWHFDPFVSSGRPVSCEVECNPKPASLISLMRDSHEQQRFQLKHDGSLRGKAWEIVSPVLPEEAAERWLFNVIGPVKANLYDRCGLHIRVGTGHPLRKPLRLSWFDLYTLLGWCKVHEADYIKLCSKSRRVTPGYNNSGRPMGLPHVPHLWNKGQWLEWLYGTKNLRDGTMHRSKMQKYRRCNDQGKNTFPGGMANRYWWLNIHSHYHHGAVEIRLHQGTVDPEKIWMWMRLWLDTINHIKFTGIKRGEVRKLGVLDIVSPDVKEYYEARREAFGWKLADDVMRYEEDE